MTPESLQELDKDTLVSLLLKVHEQYQSLSESVQMLMRDKYGTKTERFVDPDQLKIFQGTAPQEPEKEKREDNDGGSDKKVTNGSSKTKSRKRGNPRPCNLEHIPIRGEMPTESTLQCSCCKRKRRAVNETLRGSRYAYRPASVVVEDFLATIFQCDSCGSTIVTEPDVPARLLKLGADPNLISTIAVERFDDSIPLHR